MINAEDDHYVGTDEMAQETADRAGAQVVHLAGVGHWWMCEDASPSARPRSKRFGQASRSHGRLVS